VDDPIELFLEDPERRARIIRIFRLAYLLWIIMLILGITFVAIYFLLNR